LKRIWKNYASHLPRISTIQRRWQRKR
jgi:hypothetical protein